MKADNKGYTVMELLVAIAVATIVTTVLTSMIISMYRNVQISRVTSDLNNESLNILRSMVEDVRLAGGLNSSNVLLDENAPSGGWVTNDPSNILIISSPAVDSLNNIIYDPSSGLPYKNEIIYFSQGSSLLRRVIKNNDAPSNKAVSTCPISTGSCPKDREYTLNLNDLSFIFYDDNEQTTADASSARSVKFTVILQKRSSGKLINVSNTMQTTLRNK